MKRIIAVISVLLLLCLMLSACTEKQPETEASTAVLPTAVTPVSGQTSGSTERIETTAQNTIMPEDTEIETANIETTEDEMEIVDEFVVDVSGEIGIIGN